MAVILPVGWSDFEIGECCVDSTLRGQALIVEELAFNQTATINGTRRTSWGYVSPDGECITLIGDANCGGGNMSYQQVNPPPDPVCCQLNHFMGAPTVFDHPALIDPNGSHSAVNTLVGSSDEPIYVFASAGPVQTSGYYPNSQTHVVYRDPLLESVHLNALTFAKKGNRFYGICGGSSGLASRHVIVYDAQDGGPEIDNWASLAGEGVQCANATATYLVCLCFNLITSNPSIKKLSLVDGSLIESIDLTNIAPTRSFAVNDNLVYVASTSAMYYLNGTNLVFIGRLVGPTFSTFNGNGIFSGSTFYYGQTGFGDSNTDIYKVFIPCPEGGPLIASISTGTTVAHGAAINVSWDGILDPTSSDSIALRPAPVGGALGFTGVALATLSTSGPAASGTLPFTIPAPTTPGNYIFQLTRGGTILIATSNVFAVT